MSWNVKLACAALAVAFLSPATLAQFNNEWVTFANQSSARIHNPNGSTATQVTGNPDEKHFAYGDFNQDGWTDVVMVTKFPTSEPGMRRGFLLMNENGILVDRTSQYASDSDYAGSQGLLDLVNSRKAQVADVNGDGLLDLVTVATNLGPAETFNPKYVSHPRVYVNKGFDIGGNWLGLRYEESRIPSLVGANGQLAAPRGCSIAVGDVTGDGFPELYVVIYHGTETGFGDTPNNLAHDVLLLNDGTGHFTDTGTTRMSATMLDSAFGTECKIVDMNGDSARDVVKVSTLGGVGDAIAYNQPANMGFFNLYQTFNPSGAPYHIDVGDLNNDGKPDAVFSDDGADKYVFNTGNDGLGRVIWSAARSFTFPTGAGYGDDGFGSENHIVDIDGDGWKDILISSVDHDLEGCNGRLHIYHSLGGTPGSTTIQLFEEAQQSGTGGWKGVKGTLVSDLAASFDEAVLDIDNDGDNDMIIGLCSGTFLWINQAVHGTITRYCLGDGSASACPCGNNSPVGDMSGCLSSIGTGGKLQASGNAVVTADTLVLTGSQMPNSSALYFQGTTQTNGGLGTLFGDGLRCASGAVLRLTTEINTTGTSSYPSVGDPTVSVKGAVPAGATRTYQIWYRNSATFCNFETFNLSNGVQVVWAP